MNTLCVLYFPFIKSSELFFPSGPRDLPPSKRADVWPLLFYVDGTRYIGIYITRINRADPFGNDMKFAYNISYTASFFISPTTYIPPSMIPLPSREEVVSRIGDSTATRALQKSLFRFLLHAHTSLARPRFLLFHGARKSAAAINPARFPPSCLYV